MLKLVGASRNQWDLKGYYAAIFQYTCHSNIILMWGEAIKIIYVICISGLSQNCTRAVSTVSNKVLNFTTITIMGELYITFGRFP
jgi:hypothetical protein